MNQTVPNSNISFLLLFGCFIYDALLGADFLTVGPFADFQLSEYNYNFEGPYADIITFIKND